MKRSEMIELIENLLGVYSSNLLSDEPVAMLTDKATAHHWLGIIEQRGMKPPVVDKPDYPYDIRKNSYYTPSSVVFSYHKWEPEE